MSKVLRSVVTGVGGYLPETIVTNDDLAKIVETSDAWITERTGIRQRHRAAADEPVSDLAVAAARRALEAAGRRPEDVDLIVVATTTPDLTFPATATSTTPIRPIRASPRATNGRRRGRCSARLPTTSSPTRM